MAIQNSETNGNHNTNGQLRDTLVFGQTSQGAEIHATLVRLTRLTAVFEVYSPSVLLRTSEVLSDFKIVVRDRTLYRGRAVVRTLVNAGLTMVCEVTLTESAWMDVALTAEMVGNGRLQSEFKDFVHEWQKLYKILPEYKVVIADMQSFLSDLRFWMDQVELSIRSAPAGDRVKLEEDAVGQLKGQIVPMISELFDQFESISLRVDEALRPAHVLLGRRQLHPLLLSSPFVYRTFAKPLGYAGDYEMVNMMFRNECEGGSLFAKMINAYALQLPPIVAHRNRISYLCDKITEEAWRASRRGQSLRVFNLGCGPAHEVQQFLGKGNVSDVAEFTLADFNDETVAHTSYGLNELRRKYGSRAKVQVIKRTAHHLLKHADRPVQSSQGEQYDMIYCAGLFDYLSDKVCRKLKEVFYNMLAPGGLLITTNVDVHPSRNEMEYFLEWHLIHRNTEQMRSLTPEGANPENVKLLRDQTGVNIFLEIRKDSVDK
ncbi:MAG TPA: class I SAM-dependent methyltransferase [Verrucomicrobiae bacterium]|nr:class I SAM-dependent methyltransferase [Verrucomicrobiae bacterium]